MIKVISIDDHEIISSGLEKLFSSTKDIIHSGIYITGGGSQIHNLDKLFESITNIKVNTTDAPEESAVRGLVKIVSDSKFKKLPFTMKK